MGAGRKTETFIGSGRGTWPGSSGCLGNISASARNLQKANLAGVIFGCKHNTISECLVKQLFGLPGPHIAYVRKIEPGLPLFLFNYSDRKLHGIYEAASQGQMNIDPYGWTSNGKERTSYPAQVRICIKTYCQPISEALFKPIISDNYYTPRHFYFELDQTQLKGLLYLFTPTSLIGDTGLTYGTSKRSDLLMPTTKRVAEPLADAMVPGEQEEPARGSRRNPNLALGWNKNNRYASLISDEIAYDHGSQSRASCSSSEEGEIKDPVSDWQDLVSNDVAVVPSSIGGGFNEEGKTLVGELSMNEDQATMSLEERVLLKLKKPACECDSLNQLSKDSADDNSKPSVSGLPAEENKQIPEAAPISSEATMSLEESVLLKLKKLTRERDSLSQLSKDSADDNSAPSVSEMPAEENKQIPEVPPISSEDNTSTSDPYPDSTMLILMMKELQERTTVLEKTWVKSEDELRQLRNFARESSGTIQQLTERVRKLERRFRSLNGTC